jgi:predicted amidohydrolase
METLTVALWATNLARPVNGIAGWTADVDARMREARESGARLLLLPEYACEQWLSFAPAGLGRDREIAWMAEQGVAALAALAPLAKRHDMALLAGSMPVARAADGVVEHVNRAWLLLPDGRMLWHDKLVLTPGEMDPQGWSLATGDRIRVIEWEDLRLSMLICLDVEMPAIAARMAGLDLDLILVPSMTAQRSGYHRVFDCAKARAVELQTIVCAVGAVGSPEFVRGRSETNVSGAAVFLPCEPPLGHAGVAERIGPWESAEGPGPMLIARDLPIGAVRRMRHGAAEVWPGAWSADHLVVDDPAGASA